MLLVAGRIRHNRRRAAYARALGGNYDTMSGRIFIRFGDRHIEFTAVENINAYVPLPTIACSLKTTAQCDIAPAAANPMRKINQDNMPNKEIKLGGKPTYSLKAESPERLARLESLIDGRAFKLLFTSESGLTPQLQIYPLSNDVQNVKDMEESQAILTGLPQRLVKDPELAKRYIEAFNKVLDDIAKYTACRAACTPPLRCGLTASAWREEQPAELAPFLLINCRGSNSPRLTRSSRQAAARTSRSRRAGGTTL